MILLLFTLAVIPVFHPQPAHHAPLSRAVDHSSLILEVEVANAQPFHQSGRIWTAYNMNVVNSMTGEHVDVVSMVMPGGTMDGSTQQIPGYPLLYVGQELLVMKQHDQSVKLQQVLGLGETFSPEGKVISRDLVPVGPVFTATRIDLVVDGQPDDSLIKLSPESPEDASRMLKR